MLLFVEIIDVIQGLKNLVIIVLQIVVGVTGHLALTEINVKEGFVIAINVQANHLEGLAVLQAIVQE